MLVLFVFFFLPRNLPNQEINFWSKDKRLTSRVVGKLRKLSFKALMKEKISLQRLIDLHIEYRAGVPSNRELMWYELGIWQIEALRSMEAQT